MTGLGESGRKRVMGVQSCIPVIPSADLERSLRLWVDGLGFSVSEEMHKEGKLIFCMLRKGDLCFMLNQRCGNPAKPENYEGIRLYLGAGRHTRHPRAIEEPGARSFRTGRSRVWADRVCPNRR
jgi:hypothetical protein